MEKNLEKSLKRFLKRKVKITMGLVVSFLITGMVSFAEGNTKGADKKAEVKNINGEEYIINEELLKNILREISLGNIHIIEKDDIFDKSQEIKDGQIGINNGKIEFNGDKGQNIIGGLGINNGIIANTGKYEQYIENGGLGINNGEISAGRYGQDIEKGLGINNSIIANATADGQYISSYNIGINNGIIANVGGYGQNIYTSTAINNGIIANKNSGGQYIGSGGTAINNGVIVSGDKGQYLRMATGINNGIIISDTAYYIMYSGKLTKNGIALKRDDTGKLILNNVDSYNDNIDILEKNNLTGNFSDLIKNKIITEKQVGENIKGYNLFINNLGVNEQGAEDTNNKDNQLVIDTNLSGDFKNTHITTAVTENGYTKDEGVIKIADGLNNFSMEKSTIVGYFEKEGTLVDMNGATDITLNDSVISANGKETDTTNHTFLKPTAVKFGAGSNITLNNSTINGKIDFSANGDNTLNLNGKFNGMGSGAYQTGAQHGTYVSDVKFGDGSDEINIKFDGENENAVYSSKEDKKGLVTLGNVNFGAGNDTLSFSFDEMRKGNFVLAGDIDFGAGDDTVALKSKIDMNDKGETITLLNNFLFNKIKNGTLETLQLADSGNTIRFEQNIGQDKLSLNFNGKILGGKGDDKFIVSADKLKNNLNSLNGGADENKNPYNDNDILELTTVVDNTETGNKNLFDNVINVENLHLANAENKLDINNIVTADGNIKFKNYVGGDKDDSFTVSIENFEKLSSIDGGGNGTAGDTLTINGEKDDTEIFLNKTSGIEDFTITAFENKYTERNIINIDDWEYLNYNKDKISIILTQQAIDNSIKGSKESIESLKNITGNSYNTGVTLTDNISDRNVSDKGTADENYNFISKLNKVTALHLANGDNYVDVNKIIEKNLEVNKGQWENIQYIGLDKTSGNNSGTNYFKISSDNLNKIQISLAGSTSTEDTLEITDTFENNLTFMSPTGIEKLVLSGEGNNILINSVLVGSEDYPSFNEIIGKDGGEKGNIFRITEAFKEDRVLGIKIQGGISSNDTLEIATENITLSDKYNTLEKVLINKTGIENLVLGNADNTIDFTYKDQDKNLEDFKNITSGNGNDSFTVSTDQLSYKVGEETKYMIINGGGNRDTLKISGDLNNDKKSDGDKNLLSEISNIEILDLDNGENTLNLDNINLGANGFTDILSWSGKDTFKISADNLEKLVILNDKANNDNDTLEITKGGIKQGGTTHILNKVKNVENLILAENSSNNIDLDNLTFKNITAKNGEDTFKVSADKLGNFTVASGIGNDTLEIKTALSNGESLKNYKDIETLKFDASGNNVALTKENADGESFKDIIFGKDLTNNIITLANDLGAKNITFETLDETNKVSVSTADVNGVKTFEHTVKNAGRIELAQGSSEWKFGEKSLITGNTTVDFGNNILNLVENKNTIDFDNINETAKLNTGNLGLNTDGTLSMGDLSFVENNSRITVENAEIKIGFNETVKFAEGVNTKPFTITDGKEIAFGSGVTFTSPYKFIKIDGTNISVKQWNEYQGYNPDFSLYAGRYNSILKKYNGTDKESIAVTNALNGFSEKNIFDFVISKGTKLVYYSDEDSTPYNTEVTGENILIKTNPDTAKDQDMNLTFNNISSSGNIKIEITGGKDNTVTFGNVEKDSESFVSVNSIDGSSSTKDLTLNFNGKTNNADKIVINNQNSNKINISGNTTIKEITFGDGADEIYAGENSQNISIENINFGAGDDTLNIGSTGTINLSEINLGAGNNKIYFNDISKVEKFDVIKSEGDNGTNEIEITETQDNSGKFNIILAGADKDVEKITVWGENKLQITNDFSGELLFDKNNIINIETAYTGDIGFTRGENTVNISENGSIDGKKLHLAGSKNILNVNSGAVTNGIEFDTNSYGNKVTVSKNGNIGKDIIFGTEKGTDDEFTIALKDNGIFDYNVTNADVINISGVKEEIKFGENAEITSNSEITLNTNGGVIAFDINKNGNITSKNPFGNTFVKVNGDIKITLDSSVKFESLSDTINLGLGNIKSDNILTSEFLNYNGSEFSIKSAEELKAFGLGDYAFGNYEYAILNYNKAGYEGITSMLNNNNLTDISKALNKGIEQKDFYFYSDDREIKDKITLGNINIETSKDNQVTGENLNTDIKFTNVTGGTANINFAQGTTNSVSFLDGVNISKIDGSSSNAGFTLNLDGINFSKSQDAKDNTEVVMSDYADTLNINSKLEGIGINTGDGEDIVNISSYVKNITLNTGAGNDTVNILSSINGNFDGNEGDNTLNIGKGTKTLADENSQDEITLNGEIKNFQNINLNQNAKLESSLKITGTNEIKLNGNNLFVDVDYTKKADDKVIGHAFYDNGIKVDNESGKVMIDTAKAGDGTIISLGKDNKTEFTSTDKEHLLESGSSNHHIEMIDGDIVVKVNEHIMGDSETGAIKYAHLDKIYQSIVSADKIKEMSDTTTLLNKTKDEAVKAQLEFYGKIYHSTPYAYSNDVSKKSADLITESIMNLKVMPEYKHWIFGGSIAGREADSDNNFYGKNLHKVDIGKNEISADTNIYGAYAFGKYGIEKNKSIGFALAGTRRDTDISGNSKLEGDGIYVSAFAEQEMNNLKLTAGISYQHSFYDSTRNVSNDYQRMSVDKKYEDDLVSIFAGGKYSYHLGNNFFAEPNVKLSVTHVMQDKINEGDNGLTIETDKKDFTFVEGEVGIDLVKKVNLSKGTLNLRAGTSLVYLLDGYQEEYLTGRITGASKDFEMISPEDDRAKVKFTVGTEYEMTNGMFMNLYGNYTTSSHTEDYAVSFGAGYKF